MNQTFVFLSVTIMYTFYMFGLPDIEQEKWEVNMSPL